MAGPNLREIESLVASPGMSLSPSEDYEPSSTLRFVNSQLVAHGFVRAPGLSMDGISNEDGQKIVKCIMTMLSQRMEDVGRTEQLGSKLRTIGYECERLQSLNKAQQEKVENAERETAHHKSKLTASQRSHTAEVAAHKQTTAELQRTRTALQYLRTTTQNELKRKEKELERTLERWSKICDAHPKLSAASAGFQCVNLADPCEQLVGKGIMEEAFEQAEEARVELVRENEGFRSVLLGTAHALQTIAHNVRKQSQDANIPELSLLTPTAVFAPPTSYLTHPENAHLKIKELITNLKDAIADSQQQEAPVPVPVVSEDEVKKMQQTIDSLRSDLDAIQSTRARAKKDLERYQKYTSAQRPEPILKEHVGTETTTEQDTLRNELDKRSKEMEAEKKKFTETVIKLGHERSELEAERRKFLEEKRRWMADHMLASIPLDPPTEDPDLIPSPKKDSKDRSASPKRSNKTEHFAKSPKRGGVRSPKKKKVKVSFTEDKIGGSRRLKPKGSDASEKAGALLDRTEDKQVMHSIPLQPSDFVETKKIVPQALPLEHHARRHSAKDCKSFMPLILPTSFTLPPPSPGSSLSLQPLVLPSSSSLAEFPSSDIPASSTPPSTSISISAQAAPLSLAAPHFASNSASSSSNFDKIPLISPPSYTPPVLSKPSRGFPSPRTPRVLMNLGPSGMKKHDYSPAKPSPLSRILMIANSSLSDDDCLGTIKEDEEEDEMKPNTETARPNIYERTKTIQLDLGVVAEKAGAAGISAAHSSKPAAKGKKTRHESKAKVMEKENIDITATRVRAAETMENVKVKEATAVLAPKTKTMISTTTTKAEAASQVVKPGGARRVPLNTTGAGKVGSRLL